MFSSDIGDRAFSAQHVCITSGALASSKCFVLCVAYPSIHLCGMEYEWWTHDPHQSRWAAKGLVCVGWSMNGGPMTLISAGGRLKVSFVWDGV